LGRHFTDVFIDVPIPELRVRLGGRGESEEELARRMQTAEVELREKHKFSHVIVSRDKEHDFAALLAIYERAKARVAASAGAWGDLVTRRPSETGREAKSERSASGGRGACGGAGRGIRREV